MKTKILFSVLISLSFLMGTTLESRAQKRTDCISKDGYWVLVSNKFVKDKVTVQFYTNANELIYQEDVHNQKMNMNRLKTLRCLKAGLDTAMISWRQQNQAAYNKDWVAMTLRKR